jgi:hypothetical protein
MAVNVVGAQHGCARRAQASNNMATRIRVRSRVRLRVALWQARTLAALTELPWRTTTGAQAGVPVLLHGQAIGFADSTTGGSLSCTCNFKQSWCAWKYHRGRCIGWHALRPVERRRHVVARVSESDRRVREARGRHWRAVQFGEARGSGSWARAGQAVHVVAHRRIRGRVRRRRPAERGRMLRLCRRGESQR